MNGQKKMLIDIVIDTNVLVHSQNAREPRYGYCCNFLKKLLDCRTNLAVDEGFDMNPSRNRSFIGHEYLENLSFGSLAFSTITKLASSKRISFFEKRAPNREQSIINQSVRNRIDRIFLGVAYNSQERLFVSHDFIDFQEEKREFIQDQIGVGIHEVENVIALL